MSQVREASKRIRALAGIVFRDGIRRRMLIGLVILALLVELFGFVFMDFFGHDVGRAASDYLFSSMWGAGLLFLFFHAVQFIAWDEENRAIYSILAKPISRAEYVLGVTFGLSLLLLSLQIALGGIAFISLLWLKSNLASSYFPLFHYAHFFLAWGGLVVMQLCILAAIIFFSGLARGGFTVLILSLSYYFICSGLPVVRSMVHQTNPDPHKESILEIGLKGLAALFPDLNRLDLKNSVLAQQVGIAPWDLLLQFLYSMSYYGLVVVLACYLYSYRDLR